MSTEAKVSGTAPRPFDGSEKESIRQRYLRVDTSNVADVLDTMGFPDQGLSAKFAPFPSATGRMAGVAQPHASSRWSPDRSFWLTRVAQLSSRNTSLSRF